MLRFNAKKLAVISNFSTLIINHKEDLEEKSIVWDLKIVKCII